MGFFVRVIVSSIAVWLTSLWIPGIALTQSDEPINQVVIVLVVGLVFALVNAIVKPIVKVLTFPLYILTLGLFGLIVNALLLMLTGWITGYTQWGLTVDGFWPAFWGGLVISIISGILSLILPSGKSSRS